MINVTDLIKGNLKESDYSKTNIFISCRQKIFFDLGIKIRNEIREYENTHDGEEYKFKYMKHDYDLELLMSEGKFCSPEASLFLSYREITTLWENFSHLSEREQFDVFNELLNKDDKENGPVKTFNANEYITTENRNNPLELITNVIAGLANAQTARLEYYKSNQYISIVLKDFQQTIGRFQKRRDITKDENYERGKNHIFFPPVNELSFDERDSFELQKLIMTECLKNTRCVDDLPESIQREIKNLILI